MVLSVVVVIGVVLLSGGVLPDSWASRLGLGERLLGASEPAGSNTSYVFSELQAEGRSPVTWDPCTPIRYVVNPDGGPEDAVEMVHEAAEAVSTASGLEFEYAGTSDDRPGDDRRPSSTRSSYDVLFSWADEEEVPGLAGKVAGLGGAAVATLEFGKKVYVEGAATFDSGSFEDMEDMPRAGAHQRAIVLHELGHVVGLDHVEDPTQLMFARSGLATQLGAGDRRGLARLGAGDCP